MASGKDAGPVTGRYVAKLCAALLGAFVLLLLAGRLIFIIKQKRSEAPGTLIVLTVLQMLAVAATTYVLVAHPPTEWKAPEPSSEPSRTKELKTKFIYILRPIYKPSDPQELKNYWQHLEDYDKEVCNGIFDNMEYRFEPVNTMIVASMAIVSVFALLLLLFSSWFFLRGNPAGPTYATSAFVLVASVTVLHSFWSSVRLGIDWLLFYLGTKSSMGVALGRTENAVQWWERVLTAYQGAVSNDVGIFGGAFSGGFKLTG